MRKVLFCALFTLTGITAAMAQMETNGTVYIKHPAIEAVKLFTQAFVKGDSLGMARLLTDDFKAYDGLTTSPDPQGMDKEAFLKLALRWSRSLDYFSVTDFPGAYPDAIHYTKDNPDGKVWVQTWDIRKGMHKETGVQVNSAAHRLFKLNKDNKIESVIGYFNENISDEINMSRSTGTNGTIYKYHPNINTVRKSMYALENGDLDRSFSYFSKDARFFDINDADVTKSHTLGEEKAGMQRFLNTFEIQSFEMVGFPDYLEYEKDNIRSVLSWWTLHLKRKSDKKEIKVFLHLNQGFDEHGMITDQIVYYNGNLLEQK